MVTSPILIVELRYFGSHRSKFFEFLRGEGGGWGMGGIGGWVGRGVGR